MRVEVEVDWLRCDASEAALQESKTGDVQGQDGKAGSEPAEKMNIVSHAVSHVIKPNAEPLSGPIMNAPVPRLR